MRRELLPSTVGPALLAAVAGNAFVGKEALRWFRGLRQPRFAVPFEAFVAVGGVYYVLLGVTRYRMLATGNRPATRLTLAVLALNEMWNAAFFGRRSTRTGFAGMVLFTIPVVALQKAVAEDRVATLALAPYTAWVIAYDIPWSFRLWRLNPS